MWADDRKQGINRCRPNDSYIYTYACSTYGYTYVATYVAIASYAVYYVKST